MKLDLFKEVKNTLEKIDVQDFISELSDYLKNFIEKINDKLSENTEKFTTITQIEEQFNLTYQSAITLNKENSKNLKEYAKNMSEDEKMYYVSYKYENKDNYSISEYDNEGNWKNFIVSSEELPKDVTTSMILRKEKDKFVIDEEATKNIIDKAVESAKQMSNEQTAELNYLRQEDSLYYVVDANLETAYLQNLNIDVIFEEVDLPEELKGKIFTDCFLRYKNGEYIWEKELTDKFFKSLISISEYEKMQEEFINTSKIEENNPDIRYKVLSYNEEKETTTLCYEDNGIKEIEVPNKLLPYRVYEWKILYYKDGGFVTDIEATKETYEKWKNEKNSGTI